MEMHQIRYFLAVSRTLNFIRAAKECNVAQPSLTRAIYKLEEELGGELFRPERNRTHLTELGKRMISPLTQCYESAKAAKADADSFGSTEFSPLRCGVSHSIDLMIIAPTLLALAEAMPGVKLHLERGISSADANTQPRQSVRMNTSKQFMCNVGL